MATASNNALSPQTAESSKQTNSTFSVAMGEYWKQIIGLVFKNMSEAGPTVTDGQTKVLRGLGWLAEGLVELGHIKAEAFPSFETFAAAGYLPLTDKQSYSRPARKRRERGDKTKVKKDTVASSSGSKDETKDETKDTITPGKRKSKKAATSGKPKKDASTSDSSKGRKGKGKAKGAAGGGKAQAGKQRGPGKEAKTVNKGKSQQRMSKTRSHAPPCPRSHLLAWREQHYSFMVSPPTDESTTY